MYGIFTYIWVVLGVNVDQYSIHGAYGYVYIFQLHAINFQFWIRDFISKRHRDFVTYFDNR